VELPLQLSVRYSSGGEGAAINYHHNSGHYHCHHCTTVSGQSIVLSSVANVIDKTLMGVQVSIFVHT